MRVSYFGTLVVVHKIEPPTDFNTHNMRDGKKEKLESTALLSKMFTYNKFTLLV